MKNPKAKHAREVMNQIHDVLWNDWDPIGTHDYGPDDEYDSYIGGIYRILSNAPDEHKLLDHLHLLETNTMGLTPRDKTFLLPVVKKLLDIDVSLKTK